MAVDKLVDSTQLNADLTSVANAIRTRGGTSAQMAFPNGFVNAVHAIPTGGSPTGTKQITITENGTTVEDVAAYANAEITVNVQGGGDNLTEYLNNTIESYESDLVTTLKEYALAECTSLRTVKLHNVKSISAYAFRNDSQITVLAFPKLQLFLGWQVFANMSGLTTVDIKSSNYIHNNCFQNCTNFDTLIIRGIAASPVPLMNINAFNGTKFKSDGTGGILYVPQSMISLYQAETNWSTILGYANNQILPIEGSIYKTQYADGTPIT